MQLPGLNAGFRSKSLLRALVQDGLVWREVEPTTPPQVTYGLTDFGQDIGEPLTELFDRITRRLSPSPSVI
ncbi:winged helix-turn-helix transcriptional regulator [Nonomuraea typhae]|uniref:winged helix-turn-helix transcriptional regulator n=1 Tax=Nonomuraea typhae TaxID=2603600 RepID=UPI0031B6315E